MKFRALRMFKNNALWFRESMRVIQLNQLVNIWSVYLRPSQNLISLSPILYNLRGNKRRQQPKQHSRKNNAIVISAATARPFPTDEDRGRFSV